MRSVRLGLSENAVVFGIALLLTAAVAHALADGDAAVAAPLGGLVFVAVVAAVTVMAPHVLVAAAIPIFAAIPMLKVLFFPWIGPLKDAIVVAAACGTFLALILRRRTGESIPVDGFVALAAVALLGLYVLNLGGGLGPGAYDTGWAHGVRLAAGPILLLFVGLMARDPRKTLAWALASLAGTTVVVALVGLWQQQVGADGLLALGYEWNDHIKTYGGFLRSFGTVDDPFAYAAMLLFGLCAVLYYRRGGAWPAALAAILLAGLVASFVRTAIGIVLALAGLWLAQRRHGAAAVLLLAASVAAGIAVLLASSEATERRTVQAGQNTFVSINGRTELWGTVLGSPGDWPFGRGVGVVGTAAERGTFGVVRTDAQGDDDEGAIVDSGYLAAVADVGLIGLAVLLALFARLGFLAYRALQQGVAAGWFAAGVLAVMLLDAVTRSSFNGFPTAFLGFLLLGLSLAAAGEELRSTPEGHRA